MRAAQRRLLEAQRGGTEPLGGDQSAPHGGGPHRGGQSARSTGSAGTGRASSGTADAVVHRVLADRDARVPVRLEYAPHDDAAADPGEIVWSWVPFEEDPGRGKDRPVLVLAREEARLGGSDGSGQVLVALMLTSRDRGSGDHVDEHGHRWVDIGTGAWDRQRRPSEVRIDRLLRLPVEAVRREGDRLDRARYERVARALIQEHGWRV
ncbi:type II toxin-antitoxin system PemK/MazF family toxin [Brachybacterium sp. EF45031]|nr:type II toxin-antitoxin system PemK/MazF family toxin [Brachybacterium sillae]